MGGRITRPHETLIRRHSTCAQYIPELRGGNGIPYADRTHFYKIRYFKTTRAARRAQRHAYRTKYLVPGTLACHAILVERQDRMLLLKYPRYKQDLTDVLRTSSLKELDEKMVKLFECVAEVHRRGVVHGDLKPSNVLVDDNRVVLADLDTMCRPTGKRTTFTRSYSPPTVLVRAIENNDNYTWFEKMRLLDIYAMGKISSACDMCFPYDTRWRNIADLLTNTNILRFFNAQKLVTMPDANHVIFNTNVII